MDHIESNVSQYSIITTYSDLPLVLGYSQATHVEAMVEYMENKGKCITDPNLLIDYKYGVDLLKQYWSEPLLRGDVSMLSPDEYSNKQYRAMFERLIDEVTIKIKQKLDGILHRDKYVR